MRVPDWLNEILQYWMREWVELSKNGIPRALKSSISRALKNDWALKKNDWRHWVKKVYQMQTKSIQKPIPRA